MLIDDVRPSTIEGLKRLAAQYRKQHGIKHSTALDLAAKAAKCANFKHALRTLPSREEAWERPYVLLTAYWRSTDPRPQFGRETLKIALKNPILEIFSRLELKQVNGFRNLRMVATDHFICDEIANSQTHAREKLLSAERSLRFMEHTGLRPTRALGKAYPNVHVDDQLPYKDHSTNWIDPSSGQFILIDEPYPGVPDERERAAWAKRTGWRVVKTSWPGMHSPYNCDLYVATDARTAYDIDRLVETINAIPAPRLVENWPGESVSSWDTFISPAAKTPQDIRRAKCRGMIYPSATKTTLPYSYQMGNERRRPAAAMPVERHIEAGRILKAILWSDQRPHGVFRRLDSVRSTLEDWMAIEIGRDQMKGPEFFEVYYRETENDVPNRERARSGTGIVNMLGELKQMLRAAYPNCAPLRQLLHKIDMSVTLVTEIKPAE